MIRTRSLRRGHDELGTPGGTLRPALHDRLLPRIEAHAFFAIGVHVAEQTLLPSSEAVPGHRDRDRYVDSNHTHLDPPSKLPRNVSIARVTGHPISKLMRVDETCLLYTSDAADDLL